MDFYQLNTFYHVAKHMNFTRAAEELSISQPAVSRQIEALEQSLGLKLFHRAGRSVVLTDPGKTLYQMSEQILSLVNRTKSAMESMRNLESGSLHVGTSTTIGNYFIAPIVMKFIERYPGIEITLEIKSSEEIQNGIEKNILDVAIFAGATPTSSLFIEPFLLDELVLVAPKNHPLVSKENISLKDLLQEKFIIRSEGSNTRRTIEEHFKKFGLKLPSAVELNSTEAIKQAVISGSGISFLPKRTVELEVTLGVLQIIDGNDLKATRQFWIAHHKGTYPSPAVLAFTSFLKKNSY
ncbi:LysR family transcriptional regulator [Microaerobacter geothermalis]|uniref:LysR family transcriptional regulator n=1 Tax=Microaerobacter geothermalis TaxID=674972 RepID=UPI001F40DB62|nr:LysR family transcriptional regulator [Microaerobacter geothermalis]MCF6093039.1 LysR family transcriptional regulator [Microaerobacter geothermalis]